MLSNQSKALLPKMVLDDNEIKLLHETIHETVNDLYSLLDLAIDSKTVPNMPNADIQHLAGHLKQLQTAAWMGFTKEPS